MDERGAGGECWRTIGVMGARTCPTLADALHCHNCPVFAGAGLVLLQQAPPPGLQEAWTDRVAEAPDTADGHDHAVNVFRLGHEWLGLPSQAFAEIVEPQPIRSIPHRTAPALLGLVSIRGAIHLCVSLAALLHIHPDVELPEAERPTPHHGGAGEGGGARFCILDEGSHTWVFPADEVMGVQRYRSAEVEAVPATVPGTMQFMASGILPVGERRIGLLDPVLLFHALSRSVQ